MSFYLAVGSQEQRGTSPGGCLDGLSVIEVGNLVTLRRLGLTQTSCAKRREHREEIERSGCGSLNCF